MSVFRVNPKNILGLNHSKFKCQLMNKKYLPNKDSDINKLKKYK